MQRTLPGSTLHYDPAIHGSVDTLFSAMFAGGGLMLSQVAHIAGVEPYVIQNWVARGYLPAPVRKRYTCRQLCRILLIRMLRSVLVIEEICRLLSYVNGHLDDTSDDLVDDTELYIALVQLTGEDPPTVGDVLRDYREPFPGSRRRVEQVLEIMTLAYRAAEYRSEALGLMEKLDVK